MRTYYVALSSAVSTHDKATGLLQWPKLNASRAGFRKLSIELLMHLQRVQTHGSAGEHEPSYSLEPDGLRLYLCLGPR